MEWGDGVMEVDLGAAVRRWPRSGEECDRARRRLHGYLARRSFDGDVIREVLDETLPDDAIE